MAILNGWNNVADNNSGKTLGLTGIYTKGKVTWGGTKVMGKVALALEKCDNWQSAN